MKTVQELMIKRVEVVGYYPQSPYNIGEILSHIDHLDNGSDFDLYDSIAQEDCCIYAHEVEILGPSKIVYSPKKPLSCGARVWIETESEVITK